jgi:D-alanyl-D-alanine carboxypeptidase (penicillin-binding protein 5/6)
VGPADRGTSDDVEGSDGAAPLVVPAAVDITASPVPAEAETDGALAANDGAGPQALGSVAQAAVVATPAAFGVPLVADSTGAEGPAEPGGGLGPDPVPRTERRAHRRARRRIIWIGTVLLVLVLVAAGLIGAQRVNKPLPHPSLTAGLSATATVAGASPSLPWPSQGQGAVMVPALGFSAQSGSESSVPIASLTKMTNALVILNDHPIPAGTEGPNITVTAADVAEYDFELHNDQSTVAISTGEVLTERQMLEALLTQSANDAAYALATWDAGSVPAFVAKMNAMAGSLGATSSHYVDASGFDPGSVSTAADCLRIAAAGMAIPTFAEVVGMKSVTLPLVGVRPNVVSEIGSNGVIGVKSGYTSSAKGCMVLATNRVIEGRSVLVLVAVLTQPTPPPTVPTTTTTTTTTAPPPGSPVVTAPTTTTTTIPVDQLNVADPFKYTRPVVEALLNATAAAVVKAPVAAAGQMVGTVDANWGGTVHRVSVVTGEDAWLAAWPGQQVMATTELRRVPAGGAKGRVVGTAHFVLGSQSATVPLKLVGTVPEPSWWWRLTHG